MKIGKEFPFLRIPFSKTGVKSISIRKKREGIRSKANIRSSFHINGSKFDSNTTQQVISLKSDRINTYPVQSIYFSAPEVQRHDEWWTVLSIFRLLFFKRKAKSIITTFPSWHENRWHMGQIESTQKLSINTPQPFVKKEV